MRLILLATLFGLLVTPASAQIKVRIPDDEGPPPPRVAPAPTDWPDARCIWSGGAHSAFTDLARFDGQLYCTFREGSGHVFGEPGCIRIIASPDDGATWHTSGFLAEPGVDLRDPKLSVTPDGRLMVLAGGSVYDGRQLVSRRTRVSFAGPGATAFSTPVPVEIDTTIRSDDDWLWRVTWHDGRAWGVVYQAGAPWTAHLVKSRDGVRYERVTTFDLDGGPNETTLRFMPDGRMVALVRRERGNQRGVVGTSAPPFTDWTWHELDTRLGGPNFVCASGGALIAATRHYAAKREQHRTAIARATIAGDFDPVLLLPSAGDTGYPGMLVENDRLLVSYYASHEARTAIYFATIPLDAIR